MTNKLEADPTCPGSNAAAFEPRADDVFGRIAARYDLLCDLFSLGMHRLWKRRMARLMATHAGDSLLDVATGTGDIPLRLARYGGRPSRLVVSDLSPQMMAIARRRLAGCNLDLTFALLDAEKLDGVADASVDVYSISLGMKICDRRKVLGEAQRVLKPGGWFYCLEAARIPLPWLHALYLTYMKWCMPVIGSLATGGDRSAYAYLLHGVKEFPDQRAFSLEIDAAGFELVGHQNMTFGIVAIHWARKPMQVA